MSDAQLGPLAATPIIVAPGYPGCTAAIFDPRSSIGRGSRASLPTVTMIDHRLSISDGVEFLVRSVASAFDAHLAHSAATHSRAV